MGNYTIHQWVLLFFIYCFFGWIWECLFVSAHTRHWVNRGFLNGPILPIYGFGAVIILLATIPVAENLVLVYFFGMIAATLLEYVTGAVMEKLFRVRYWDYSSNPLNLNGYICLGCSLGWGVFSVVLIRFLHPPIERLLLRVPEFLTEPLAFVLTIAMTVDVVLSVRDALDFKETLSRLAEESEDLRRLQKRVEIVAAFAEEDLQELRGRVEQLLEDAEERRQDRAEEKQARRQRVRIAVEAALEKRYAEKSAVLQELLSALNRTRDKLTDTLEQSAQSRERKRAELSDALTQLRRQTRTRAVSRASYRKAFRILRANPSAKARGYAEVFAELRQLSEKKK